jgi:hypothetical protein
MTLVFRPGDEYTPGVATAFAALLAVIDDNRRLADGSAVVIREGDESDLSALLSLDTDLAIEIVSTPFAHH